MTLTESPRRSAAWGDGVLSARPMRHPDASDEQVMTRRGWWLVVINWLIPGSAQVLAGSRRLGRFGISATLVMWLLVVLLVAGLLLWRSVTLSVLINPFVLVALTMIVVAYGVLWIILSLDALRLTRLVKTATPRSLPDRTALRRSDAGHGKHVAFAAPRMLAASNAIDQVFSAGAPIEPDDGYYNIATCSAATRRRGATRCDSTASPSSP